MSNEINRPAVLVIDDHPDRAEGWAQRIRANQHADVTVKGDADRISELVEELKHLQSHLRGKQLKIPDGTYFDQFDVVFVDYDLIGVDSGLTADNLTYLMTLFSDTAVIAMVNKYSKTDFDLKMLPHLDDHVDLHIGDPYMANDGLWSSQYGRFRPWHWPDLTLTSVSYERRIEDVLDNFDEPLSTLVGFDITKMPQKAFDWFPDNDDVGEMTARQWLSHNPSLFAPKDHDAFQASLEELEDRWLARLVARHLYRILDRVVLPTQTVLMDLPHAYMKAPGAFSGTDRNAVRNNIARLDLDPTDVLTDVGQQLLMEKSWWLGRPVLDWTKFDIDDDSHASLLKPFDESDEEYVFLEDRSIFVHWDDAWQFVPDIDAHDNVRYVDGRIEGISYRPNARLAL